jgi:hypothetical protein
MAITQCKVFSTKQTVSGYYGNKLPILMFCIHCDICHLQLTFLGISFFYDIKKHWNIVYTIENIVDLLNKTYILLHGKY